MNEDKKMDKDKYQGARFQYVRNVYDDKGRLRPVSFAYRFDDENKQVVFNTAVCSKKDVFNRAIGRAVSLGRLLANTEKHPNRTVPYSHVSGPDGKPRFYSIAAHLSYVAGEAVS